MKVLRRLFVATMALVAIALPAAAQAPKTPATAPYRIALHVDDNDAARMGLALNNVKNIIEDFKKSGQKVEIEVVTYGPGLHMFREDTSPVKARVQEMSLAYPNVKFAACQNTQANMAKAENKQIVLIPEVKLVPSGVVHLVELQRKGWAYIKP